jgi:FixJ family two-component response regulator
MRKSAVGQTEADMKNIKNLKVLLVDDDDSIRNSMHYFFKKKTKVFKTVETAELGLESLRNGEAWDIIISDYKLSGMNGIDFLGLVRKKAPDTMTALITAYGSIDIAVKAIKAGIHDFIQKPFTTKEIKDSLHFLMAKQGKSSEKQSLDQPKKDKATHHNNTEFGVSMISNQINNRLYALSASAELGLKKSGTNTAGALYFQDIIQHLEMIQNANARLASLEKIPSVKTRQKIKPAEALDQAVSTYKYKCRKAGIKIIKNYTGRDHSWVETDKGRLIPIIDNVLINAIQCLKTQNDDFSKEIRVGIRDQGDGLEISIADNGKGMDPETLEKATQRGFSTKPGSPGMGLFIAQKLCGEIGITLKIQSKWGTGTQTSLWIPN